MNYNVIKWTRGRPSGLVRHRICMLFNTLVTRPKEVHNKLCSVAKANQPAGSKSFKNGVIHSLSETVNAFQYTTGTLSMHPIERAPFFASLAYSPHLPPTNQPPRWPDVRQDIIINHAQSGWATTTTSHDPTRAHLCRFSAFYSQFNMCAFIQMKTQH